MNNGKDKGLSCNQAFMHESVMGMKESSWWMSMKNEDESPSIGRRHRITGCWTGEMR